MPDNNINSVKINLAEPDKASVPQKANIKANTTEQTNPSFIKIEPKKEDKVDISFDTKNQKSDSIQPITFVEKEENNEIKAIINDLTTLGPLKLDKIILPIPSFPGETKGNMIPKGSPGEKKTTPKQENDRDQEISVKIKVEF